MVAQLTDFSTEFLYTTYLNTVSYIDSNACLCGVTSLDIVCGLCILLCLSMFYRQPSRRLNFCSILLGCRAEPAPLEGALWRHPGVRSWRDAFVVFAATSIAALSRSLGASPSPSDIPPVSEWESEREAQDSLRPNSGGLFVSLFLCYFESFVVSIFVVSPFFHYSIYFDLV